MSYDPTNSDRFSELLSAYLDGELTADEQALVEGRLAENAEFRQLHDELRALRSGLESLFRYRLKEDLAASVLRRAERAMLSAPAVVPAASAVPEAKQVSLAESVPVSERALRGLRAFRWSIVALAVALLIMIFNPGQDKDGREVALEKKQSEKNSDAEGKDVVAAPSDLAMQAKEASADAFTLQEGESLREAAAGEDASFAARRMSAKGAQAPAESRSLEKNAKQRERGEFSKLADDRVADDPGLAEEAPQAAGVSAPMPAEEAAELAAPGRVVGDGTAASRFSGNRTDQVGRNGGGVPGPLVTGGRVQAPGAPIAGKLRQGAAMAGKFAYGDDGLLIVQCDISPEAARSGAFAQLLAEQQIALLDGEQTRRMNRRGTAASGSVNADAIEAVPAPGATAEPATELPANAPATELNDTVGDVKNNSADKKEAPRQLSVERKIIEADLAQGGWGDAPPLDAVLVEASPEQIAATFAGLQSRSEEFYSLNFQAPQSSIPAEKSQIQFRATDALVADETLADEDAAALGKNNEEKAVEESKADQKAASKPANGTATDDNAAQKGRSGKREAGKKKAESQRLKSATVDAPPAEVQLDELGGFGGGGANYAAGAGGLGAVQDVSRLATAQRVPIDAEQFQQLAPQVAPLSQAAVPTEGFKAESPAAIQSQQPQLRKLSESTVPAAAPAAPLVADAPAPARSEPMPESLEHDENAPHDAQAAAPVTAPPMRVLFLFRVVPAKPASR